MGFDQIALNTVASTEPLWRQFRDKFPVTANLIYLNHAAL
jgi:hypothetical protein